MLEGIPSMRRAYSRHYGWAGMAVLAGLLLPVVRSGAAAAQAMQTFGPGQVNCEALGGTQVDCLLAAGLVTPDNSNVATFSVGVLPQDEQALFRRWCVDTANECTVTVTGAHRVATTPWPTARSRSAGSPSGLSISGGPGCAQHTHASVVADCCKLAVARTHIR